MNLRRISSRRLDGSDRRRNSSGEHHGSSRRLIVWCALAVSLLAANAGAQTPARFIVQLAPETPFERYVSLFAADNRFSDARLRGYHDRGVLGTIMLLERRYGFRADAFFSRAIKGFAANLTSAQQRRLAADPLVASLEPDELVALEPVETASQTVDWGIYTIGANLSSTVSGDGAGTVTGVHIYVIDTGVDASHPDLNVVEHVSMIGAPNADCHGHGTGVAGIIAARDNGDYTVGVAPGAPIHGVKVLSCAGVTFPSFLVQAVDWVTANAIKPAVANMSIGSIIALPAVNTAVRNSAASGIVYAVAAGNGNPFAGNEPMNACQTSPAGAALDIFSFNGIMAVGATDISDVVAPFSNFGPCVRIWAPGVDVTSTWLTSGGGMITASGTSFASPYVAGAAALLLSQLPSMTPSAVEFVLWWLTDIPGTVSSDGAPVRRLQVRDF
jgi:subtilisin family serine protease